MKTLLLLFICVSVNAQTNIGLTYNYDKNGIGIILDQHVSKDFSFIATVEKGNYGHIDILKYGGGVGYKLFIVNILHNKINTDNKIHKNSVEIGFKDEFIKNIQFMMLYDVLNYEPRVGVTIKIR